MQNTQRDKLTGRGVEFSQLAVRLVGAGHPWHDNGVEGLGKKAIVKSQLKQHKT